MDWLGLGQRSDLLRKRKPATPTRFLSCPQALCLVALAVSRAANIYPLSLLCNTLRPLERHITQVGERLGMKTWNGSCYVHGLPLFVVWTP